MPHSVAMSRSSRALHNLRAVVILIVLAFHSVLAYVQWIPERSAGFDDPPYLWRAFPIVDSHRWFGFDLFCAWQDVFLMSLMFLLSGLFVWPSLQRKRGWGFVRDRLRRLGLPFAFGVLVLIPIAVYPTYLAIGGDPSLTVYLQHYVALPFLPNGQLWFLWQLLALNFVVVGLNWIAPDAVRALGRWSAAAGQRPHIYFSVLIALSAIAYVPLALAFHAVGLVQFRTAVRAMVPPASLWRLLFRRRGNWRRRHRCRPGRRRRRAWAALETVARRGDRFVVSLDGRDRPDHERSGAGRASKSPPLCVLSWLAPAAVSLSSPRACVSAPRLRPASTASRPMPTAFIWCTTTLSFGCNTRCSALRCSL